MQRVDMWVLSLSCPGMSIAPGVAAEAVSLWPGCQGFNQQVSVFSLLSVEMDPIHRPPYTLLSSLWGEEGTKGRQPQTGSMAFLRKCKKWTVPWKIYSQWSQKFIPPPSPCLTLFFMELTLKVPTGSANESVRCFSTTVIITVDNDTDINSCALIFHDPSHA